MFKSLYLNLHLDMLNDNIKTKNISCHLKGNNNNFLQYICIFNFNENEIINKVAIKDNLYSEQKTMIDYIPLAKKIMNNINEQVMDRFSSKTMYVLFNSSLNQNEDNFIIEGYIDNSYFDSNNINISIFNNENEEIIICFSESKTNKRNNYKMKCNYNNYKEIKYHLNKTLGEADNKIILILFNEENNDLLNINKTSDISLLNSGLSKLFVVAIALSCVILVFSLGYIFLFVKFKNKKEIKKENIDHINNNINIMSSARLNY
jgi:hypothetical protein